MSTYVITVPGTFLSDLTDSARVAVEQRLRSADPHRTALGKQEDLDVLTVNDNGTFSIHVEVEADDSRTAERRARETAAGALREAGYTPEQAPLGPAVVTGIDNQA
ncbi:hypothetical protein [Streptomyces ficellus]|uniref:Uncharacterized protein n=1 Tax=Streptomyces ficellus TaxID=1977088 RepID=A0A6I6FLA9_9ACTN|nr:hypothetical protein [Streptomyces ficellus]QGV82287.1 hypothetical protein EIZ62_31545 [Streptomyces ficellus]